MSRPAPTASEGHEAHYVTELRQRVLDELAVVRGRVELSTHLDDTSAKELLREAHSGQRASILTDSAEWLSAREATLLEHFADGKDIDPYRIDPVIVPVRTELDADLFRFATLSWSVPVSAGYGRRSRFLVRDRFNGKLIAVFALGDPVIGLAARDDAIGWTATQRHERLYNVYDAFVLGAVEPYRQLLAGKLAALLSLANETRDFLTNKYAGTETGIRKARKDPTPVLITTSSSLGRSSIYNRLTFRSNLMFHSVGFTKGFGHFQFSEGLFEELVTFSNTDNRFGAGANWKFRTIREALSRLGIPEDSLQHNIKREVFLAPTAAGWDSYLRGEADGFIPFNLPADEIGAYYRERWAIGRAERRPGFAHWRKEGARLTPLLAAAKAPRGLPVRASHGRVDLGAYSIAVGVQRVAIAGTSASGTATSGEALVSRVESTDFIQTIAELQWANGDREVREWKADDNDLIRPLDEAVGRIIGEAPRFRGMAIIDPIAESSDEMDDLSALLGFDVAEAFDTFSETTVGSRRQLLKQEIDGDQVVAVFDHGDHVTPVVIWALTRSIAMRLRSSSEAPAPSAPTLVRRPPLWDEVPLDGHAAPAA